MTAGKRRAVHLRQRRRRHGRFVESFKEIEGGAELSLGARALAHIRRRQRVYNLDNSSRIPPETRPRAWTSPVLTLCAPVESRERLGEGARARAARPRASPPARRRPPIHTPPPPLGQRAKRPSHEPRLERLDVVPVSPRRVDRRPPRARAAPRSSTPRVPAPSPPHERVHALELGTRRPLSRKRRHRRLRRRARPRGRASSSSSTPSRIEGASTPRAAPRTRRRDRESIASGR